jgi:AcrR family transcriptional regulator
MSDTSLETGAAKPARKRRSDGERSRNAILREAAQLATIDGLNGLSISRLADAVGMSKSGLFAHFGSKQELQLATIEAASAIFSEQVLEPALLAPTGMQRLRLLADRYLSYIEAANFPGGCFFASIAAEMDTHPGPVRDVAVGFMADWLALLAQTVEQAQAEGDLDPEVEPAQLAFEIEAHLLLSNALFAISAEAAPIERARKALDRRFGEVATVSA